MKQIDTLVFYYGGVLVNIDDGQVVRALKNLGISRLKQLWYARTIKRLMHQFIDGLVPEDDTLDEMLKLCWSLLRQLNEFLCQIVIAHIPFFACYRFGRMDGIDIFHLNVVRYRISHLTGHCTFTYGQCMIIQLIAAIDKIDSRHTVIALSFIIE